MTQNLTDVRTFRYEDETGKTKHMKVKYAIMFKGGAVHNVFNELGYSVDKNSETFEHYSNKYNK